MAAGHHPYEYPGSPSGRWLDGDREAAAQRATLRFVDDRLRELLDGLRSQQLLDSTLVAIVSDHGPGSGRAGMGRIRDASIYEGSVHVPLVVSGPQLAGAGGAVTLPTGHIDLAPTLLGLLGSSAARHHERTRPDAQQRAARRDPGDTAAALADRRARGSVETGALGGNRRQRVVRCRPRSGRARRRVLQPSASWSRRSMRSATGGRRTHGISSRTTPPCSRPPVTAARADEPPRGHRRAVRPVRPGWRQHADPRTGSGAAGAGALGRGLRPCVRSDWRTANTRWGARSCISLGGTESGLGVDPRGFAAVGRLARGPFDVIHVHEPLTPLVPWLVVGAARAPLVGTFHVHRESGHRLYAIWKSALGAARPPPARAHRGVGCREAHGGRPIFPATTRLSRTGSTWTIFAARGRAHRR